MLEFEDLKPGREYLDFVDKAKTHKKTKEYRDYMESIYLKRGESNLEHIWKNIVEHFNNRDIYNFKKELTCNISQLSKDDIVDLMEILINKEYSMRVNKDNTKMTIY